MQGCCNADVSNIFTKPLKPQNVVKKNSEKQRPINSPTVRVWIWGNVNPGLINS